jgi:anti-sigma B factor antagonist
MPRQLEIRTSNEAGRFVVSLTGELDLASAPSLERALAEAEAAGPGGIVVDLSGLEFMDSTGLQSLIAAFKRAKSDGYELRLRRGRHQVQRVFELTSTIELFQFED